MQFQSAKALVFGSRLFLLTQSKVYNQCIVRLSFNMPFVRWFRVHFGSLKLNTMCALRAEFHFKRSIDCLSLVDFVYFYFLLKPHRISAIRFVSTFFSVFLPQPIFRIFLLFRYFEMDFDKCFCLYVISPSTIFRTTVGIHFNARQMQHSYCFHLKRTKNCVQSVRLQLQ